MIRNLSYNRFVVIISTSGLIYILLLILLKFVFLLNPHFLELVTGWVLSSFNVLIGVRILEKALPESQKKFLIISFGSMMIRMFGTVIILLLLILILHFDRISFVFSLFGFYFFYLLLEILYLTSLSKKINIKKD